MEGLLCLLSLGEAIDLLRAVLEGGISPSLIYNRSFLMASPSLYSRSVYVKCLGKPSLKTKKNRGSCHRNKSFSTSFRSCYRNRSFSNLLDFLSSKHQHIIDNAFIVINTHRIATLVNNHKVTASSIPNHQYSSLTNKIHLDSFHPLHINLSKYT